MSTGDTRSSKGVFTLVIVSCIFRRQLQHFLTSTSKFNVTPNWCGSKNGSDHSLTSDVKNVDAVTNVKTAEGGFNNRRSGPGGACSRDEAGRVGTRESLYHPELDPRRVVQAGPDRGRVG